MVIRVPSRLLTHPRWNRPVFRIGSRPYSWLDVLLGAMARGDWARFEAHLAAGAACAAAAEGADAWPEAHDVEAAATRFRYERDLLTSEETEGWLARAGLSLETWSEVLTRDVLRARSNERLAGPPGTGDVSHEVDGDLVAAEGICSGTFAEFARTLAERLAVAETASGLVDAAAVSAAVATARSAYAGWLGTLDAGAVERRLTDLATADAAYTRVAGEAVLDSALLQHLDRYRLEWMRIDLERLAFSTAEAAREAAWCVREDGLTLSEVAIESRQPVEDVRTLLDGLAEPLRDAVLSARPDDLVGPVAVEDRYEVALVVAKHPATLDDPLVRARAARSVVEALTAKAVLAHVTWIEKPVF